MTARGDPSSSLEGQLVGEEQLFTANTEKEEEDDNNKEEEEEEKDSL